jgi:hypothetical protein
MTNVKVLEKKVKHQGQRLEGQGHDIKWKVLPEEIHMRNIKALPPTNQKLWPTLKFMKKVKFQVNGQRGSRSSYQMKGLARRNTRVK